MRLSVDLILYEICCGQGQALSLRIVEIFNAISTVNYHISITIQRRQQATALPRRRLHRIVRNSPCAVRQRLPCKGSCRFFETKK